MTKSSPTKNANGDADTDTDGNGNPRERNRSEDGYPIYRNHFVPRSTAGRVALVSFIALFALAEPPLLYAVANRIEPWILGVPFLYAYLFVVYAGLIGLLLWVQRRGL